MPSVEVYRDEKHVSDRTLTHLRDNLPDIVAKHLSCDDADDSKLTTNDIRVVFHNFGQFDVYQHPLELSILGNAFPSRVANVDERARQIHRDIEELLTPLDVSFFVYVLLGSGGFAGIPEVKSVSTLSFISTIRRRSRECRRCISPYCLSSPTPL